MLAELTPVLLVDDHPPNLLALEAVLTGPGLDLVRAGSGEQALALLADRDFAVILLDLNMPGLNGFETAKLVRARERSRTTPVIFVTARDAADAPLTEAYQLGAVDFLVKPLVPDILRAKVAVFVDLYLKTERVRALEREAAERDAEERFRVLTESSSDAVALVGADGTVLYASPSARRILGRSPAEVVGRSGFEFIHPDDVGDLRRQLDQLLTTRDGAIMAEIRARHRDGRWRWIEYVGTNLLGNPVVRAVVVNFRDVTDRRQAAESLRDREALLRTLGDNLPGGAVYQVMPLPGGARKFTYVSAGIERLFGVTPAEVLADPTALYGLILPEDAPRVLAEETVSETTGGPFDCEFRARTRPGEVKWVHCRSAPRRLPDGRVLYDGLIMDVTGRKLAEAQLRDRAEEVEALMQIIPVGVWMAHDPDCRVVTGNRAGEALLRMPGGANLSAAAPPGERPTHFRVLQGGRELTADELPLQAAVTRGVEVRDFEEEVVFGDGTVVHLYGSAVPLRDGEGRVRGGVAAFVDVSGLRQLEREIRETADALAEAGRRKDEFLAMLAHELRNPLAPIRNGLHVLRLADRGLPSVVGQAVEMMDRQVTQMSRLIDDLLDVSRITRGKVQLRPVRVDLRAVVRAAVETSTPLVEAGGHDLAVVLPADPVWVDADPTRLAQVVSNLLNNAAKYTGPGGRIRVEAVHEPAGAVVRVRDNGAGISPEILSNVFDLFVQADRSLDRSQGGLGIGLTVVRSLVEMHGGVVEAHSAGHGHGSEFVVRLPSPVEPTPGGFEPAEHSGKARTARRRVLVVEDNRDGAESLRAILELAGHEATVAYDGVAGLEAARQVRPDVVLCDIGLPGLDGYRVAQALRADRATAGARLVSVSGYGQEEDRRRSREAGFDHHLVKPVAPEDVVRAVTNVDPGPVSP
ncbi:MAG: domain S-box-containing protein [Gemmataceae bacterium]|nr:domain S-box-containing protein [Gemmataceae bacterium]